MKLRCELHCHSDYSRDCDVSLKKIIAICQRREIDCLALTDHNEIAGALALRKIAPKWLRVIVGEEIATRQGDIIGLFLKERIEPGQDIEKTIAAIRSQEGLVLLPHPFDRLRREAVGKDITQQIRQHLDFIETFNSRCVFRGDNHRAARFATQHHLFPFVGSDAHTPREYGKSLCVIETFHHPISFRHNLRDATFITGYSPLLVHLNTQLVAFGKRHRQKKARIRV